MFKNDINSRLHVRIKLIILFCFFNLKPRLKQLKTKDFDSFFIAVTQPRTEYKKLLNKY